MILVYNYRIILLTPNPALQRHIVPFRFSNTVCGRAAAVGRDDIAAETDSTLWSCLSTTVWTQRTTQTQHPVAPGALITQEPLPGSNAAATPLSWTDVKF